MVQIELPAVCSLHRLPPYCCGPARISARVESGHVVESPTVSTKAAWRTMKVLCGRTALWNRYRSSCSRSWPIYTVHCRGRGRGARSVRARPSRCWGLYRTGRCCSTSVAAPAPRRWCWLG
jgi:hypothetical protein